MTLNVYPPLIRFLQVKRSISSLDEGNRWQREGTWQRNGRSVNSLSALANDQNTVHRATRCVLRWEASGNRAGLPTSRGIVVPKQRIAAQISWRGTISLPWVARIADSRASERGESRCRATSIPDRFPSRHACVLQINCRFNRGETLLGTRRHTDMTGARRCAIYTNVRRTYGERTGRTPRWNHAYPSRPRHRRLAIYVSARYRPPVDFSARVGLYSSPRLRTAVEEEKK